MKLSIIFSALFSVIAAQSAKTTETWTIVGKYLSTTHYTTGTHNTWTVTKAAVAGSTDKTATEKEQNLIKKEINRLIVPSSSKFQSVTILDATTALTQIKITKMGLKSGASAGNANSLEVTFTATLKAGVRDTQTTAATIKAALLHTTTPAHTTQFKTVTSVTASAKSTFKVSALYTTTDTWKTAYSSLSSSTSILYITEKMNAIFPLVDAQVKADCADSVKLTNADIHVNQLIHKAAAAGRKRRSTATGTVNVKFTASVKAPTGTTATTSAKLVTAVNKAAGISGAAKSSAERMIASVTMTLFALGFYMF